MTTDNLSLWRSVEMTDPSRTKPFLRTGGFKGTATNPTWLARCATEQFGPCGQKWGINVIDERYVDAPNGDIVHVLRCKFWYILDEQRGEIECYGATTFAGKNKYGPYSDEDASKKSLTDAMTKAMSWLGFAADIHMGLFDDVKYVADAKKHFEQDATEGDETDNQLASINTYLEMALSHIQQETDIHKLKQWWYDQGEYRKSLGIGNGTPEYPRLFGAFMERGKELAAKNNLKGDEL